MAGSGEFFHWDTKYHSGERLSGVTSPPPRERFEVSLPPPLSVKLDIRSLVAGRSSVREFSRDVVLSMEELSTVLWFSMGATGKRSWGYSRAFPSAGALYPTEAFVAVRLVEGLESGVYRYIPKDHGLELVGLGNVSRELAKACLGQMWISDAQAAVVITAVASRMTAKYGDRGFRYIYMEAGHIGQGIYLAASALGLGTCGVGAFFDDDVASIVGVDPSVEMPLYIFPVGKL